MLIHRFDPYVNVATVLAVCLPVNIDVQNRTLLVFESPVVKTLVKWMFIQIFGEKIVGVKI